MHTQTKLLAVVFIPGACKGVFEMVEEFVRSCKLGELGSAQPVSYLGYTFQGSSRKEHTGIFCMKCFSVTGDWGKYIRQKLATEIDI